MVADAGIGNFDHFDKSAASLAGWSGVVDDSNMGRLNAHLPDGRLPFSTTAPNGSSNMTTHVPADNIKTSAISLTALRSPGSEKSSSKKRSSPDSTSSPDDNDERVTKRQRNTEAARRYRQRKMDRVSELEEALALMTKERDDLKLSLARSQAEADVLRGMVSGRS